MYLKPKDKRPTALGVNRELLAFWGFRGGLAEWSNAAGLRPVDDAYIAVQGFESLTRRQNSNNAPAEAVASTGEKTAQPKPYESVRPQYPAFGCGTQLEISQ